MARTFAAANSKYLQLAQSVLPTGTRFANFHCALSCWFYPTANIQEGLVAVQKSTGGNSLNGWGIRYISALSVYGAYVQSDSGQFSEARGQAQVLNKWAHVMGFWTLVSGTQPWVDIWVNGVGAGNQNVELTIGGNFGTITPDKTTIGAEYYNAALGDYATGNIADVSIWYFGDAGSLPYDELIQFLAHGGSPLQFPAAAYALRGYWPLRGSNPELDLSKYRRHLALYNSPAWTPGPALAKPTDFGQYGFGVPSAPAATARSFAVIVG